jgi:hypothetical protein
MFYFPPYFRGLESDPVYQRSTSFQGSGRTIILFSTLPIRRSTSVQKMCCSLSLVPSPSASSSSHSQWHSASGMLKCWPYHINMIRKQIKFWIYVLAVGLCYGRRVTSLFSVSMKLRVSVWSLSKSAFGLSNLQVWRRPSSAHRRLRNCPTSLRFSAIHAVFLLEVLKRTSQ